MLSTFLYRKGAEVQTTVTRAQMLACLKEKEVLLWVDLEAPNDFEIDCLVEIFNFHPLAIEDCLSDHHEPKVDDYDEYMFLVMHSLRLVKDAEREVEELATIELNIFFGRNYVVTFHKTPVPTIEQTLKAVAKKPERFLSHGADILVHAILDRLVDNYQPMLDIYEKKVGELEDKLFENPPADYLSAVLEAKRNIFNLRRTIAPQRDIIYNLTKTANLYIKQKHLIYFKDVYDHMIRIHGITDVFHESLSNIMHAYFSYSSHKLNEVIKHMTVLATVTMPAIIVASIYGMNFENMPELGWKLGYPFALVLSLSISAALLGWMKWKKWM